MQPIYPINCQRFAHLNGTKFVFTITLKVQGNSICWFYSFVNSLLIVISPMVQ